MTLIGGLQQGGENSLGAVSGLKILRVQGAVNRQFHVRRSLTSYCKPGLCFSGYWRNNSRGKAGAFRIRSQRDFTRFLS